MRRLLGALPFALACDGGATAEAPPECAPTGDGVHVLCLEVDAADLAALLIDPFADVEVPAGAWLDGVRHEGAALELHGGFARTVAKKSYRLRLGDDAVPVRLFDGALESHKRVVLQAAWVDPSFLRNRLTFDAVRAAGGLAPRLAHARVRLNGAPLGLFQVVERIDKHYLRRHGFGDRVNLYKAEDHAADFGPTDQPLEGYDHEIAGGPVDDLADLLAALDATPLDLAAYEEAIAPRLDLADVSRYHRVHSFAMDRDAYTKNYFLARDLAATPGTPTARFRLISWDADATFCQNWDGTAVPPTPREVHGWDQLAARLFAIPAYREAHLADYRAALADALDAGALLADVAALAEVIAADARADLASWQPGLDFDAEVARLAGCVAARDEVMTDVLE